MKRRPFLQKAALGSLAVSTLPLFNISARKKKDDKLGFALVGLGNYAGGQLAPALQQTKNCYLAGIVTGTPAKEGIWAEKYGIPDKNIYDYNNFDEIAGNDDIDVVYVVLPNNMHAEYTIRALQAGKHVTSENLWLPAMRIVLEWSKRPKKRIKSYLSVTGFIMNHTILK